MPETPAEHPKLILASRSPRRAALLRDAGYVFDQADPPFDDPPAPNDTHGRPPQEEAAALARRKAQSLRDATTGHVVILAADTICIGSQGGWIGTPADRDDARRMIGSFVNADHEVITGVALIDGVGRAASFADTATVRFGVLSDGQIEAYLDTGQWRDKAGGYNLFDRTGDDWPITVTGDPTTVVGLPMRRVTAELAKFGVRPEHT